MTWYRRAAVGPPHSRVTRSPRAVMPSARRSTSTSDPPALGLARSRQATNRMCRAVRSVGRPSARGTSAACGAPETSDSAACGPADTSDSAACRSAGRRGPSPSPGEAGKGASRRSCLRLLPPSVRRPSAAAEPDLPSGAAGSGRRHRGLLRSVRLFRLFPKEQPDPESFYAGLAEDTVRQVEDYCELQGRTVVDVGGGPGHFTAAFAERGAKCYLFEPDSAEMLSRGAAPSRAGIADRYWLPVPDVGARVCLSRRVPQHV